MVAEAERLKSEDAVRLMQVEARNELEAMLYTAREVAETHAIVELHDATLRMREWLDDAPESTPVVVYRSKIRELEAALNKA